MSFESTTPQAASNSLPLDSLPFHAIPGELKRIPQWVVYRKTPRGSRITKVPMRLDCNQEFSTTLGAGCGTFEQACEVYRHNHTVLAGVGLWLTKLHPYVCVDFDDVNEIPDHGDRVERQSYQDWVLGHATYAEYSPSGKGLHVWFRAEALQGTKFVKRLNFEIYAFDRYMTMTGKPVDPVHAGGVADGADFVRMMRMDVAPAPRAANLSLVGDDHGRPLLLSDEQVLENARRYNRKFSPRYDGDTADDDKDWSSRFTHVVGVLVRQTGSVSQIERLMLASRLVTESDPTDSGETRTNKCNRILADNIARARSQPDAHENRAGIEHGRRVWEAICAENDRRQVLAAAEAQAAADRLVEDMREAEEAVARDGAVDLRGSESAKNVLARFAALGGDPMHLRVPPGRMGELVMASMRANPVPYLKYALPAALATISGVIGRAYAPDRGGPLNMNYILVAPSSTGKTVSMDVWNDFLAEVNRSLPVILKPVDRLIKNGTMSVQGIWPVFEEVPSCVWFIEEAASQLNGMSAPKSATDEHVSDFYKQLYDSGKHGKVSTIPRSAASKNSGMGTIEKLCVSTYWTTTPDAYQFKDKDINGGLASRAVFVHHDKPGGAKSRYYDAQFPEHLVELMRNLLIQAGNADRAYAAGSQQGAGITILVDTSGINDAWWELDCVCDAINREAILGTLPKVYQAMSRVPMNARRMACALAVVENPWEPSVTVEQLTWCHNYLMHNAISLLAATDAGEAGDNVTDEVLAAKRIWRGLVRAGAMKGLPGVAQNKLLTAMASHAPFRTHRNGRSKSAADCIKLMVEQQMFQENAGQAPGRGRPAKYLLLVDD